jgi:hypothetical protein
MAGNCCRSKPLPTWSCSVTAKAGTPRFYRERPERIQFKLRDDRSSRTVARPLEPARGMRNCVRTGVLTKAAGMELAVHGWCGGAGHMGNYHAAFATRPSEKRYSDVTGVTISGDYALAVRAIPA